MGVACSSCSKCAEKAGFADGKKLIMGPKEELKCFHDWANGHLIDPGSKHGLKEAFDKLGGKDDNKCTRQEMTTTLNGLGYPGDASHLFDIYDVDNSDFVTREELVASTKIDFIEASPLRKIRRFFEREFIADHYDESLDMAFHEMDIHEGRHTEVVTREDFCKLLETYKYTGDSGIAYEIMDMNHDETVTFGEFKKRLHALTRHQ